MSGPTTSFRTAPTTEGASECSRQTLRVCADIIDEFTRECLTIRIGRKLKAVDVIDTLSDLFILRGVPGHIRSDNGPEFVAKAGARVDCRCRGQHGLHHARQSLGERLLRELQLEASRRAAQRRDFLHAGGGQGRHRRMAPALQHGPAALILGLQTACAGSYLMAGFASRPSFAGHADDSASERHPLTFKLDHSMGAGQFLASGPSTYR